MEEINHIQSLNFELIKTIQYNAMDGGKIVEDLLAWRPLWESAIAVRHPLPKVGKKHQKGSNYPPLSLLRTTRHNDWPADTLYIWTDEVRLPQLTCLIEEHWQADVIESVGREDMEIFFHDPTDRVLMIWWD